MTRSPRPWTFRLIPLAGDVGRRCGGYGLFYEDDAEPEDLGGGQGEVKVVFFGQFADDDAVAFHAGMHFSRKTAGDGWIGADFTDVAGFGGKGHALGTLGVDELLDGGCYIFVFFAGGQGLFKVNDISNFRYSGEQEAFFVG